MAELINMPRQGQSVESCVITKWLIKKGDMVNKGDVIFTYETDKSSFDYESRISGRILDILYNEGDDVPVLKPVCIIGDVNDDISQIYAKVNENTTETGVISKRESEVLPEIRADAGKDLRQGYEKTKNQKLKISPRAKLLAGKLNIDLSSIKPDNPDGMITEEDIKAIYDSQVRSADQVIQPDPGRKSGAENDEYTIIQKNYEECEITNLRRLISKKMMDSISSTAQVTLNTSFDASDMVNLRMEIKKNKDKYQNNITLNDMMIFAVSRTVLNHKVLNAHFVDGKIRYFSSANIGIAVESERGLLVPVIMNANSRSLSEISIEAGRLIEECRMGKINPDLLNNSTFTVTNLGMFNIESFTPIINLPETAILGVGSITYKVRQVNVLTVYPAIGLSLTFDHRVIDGAQAARFLKELAMNLENFRILLAR